MKCGQGQSGLTFRLTCNTAPLSIVGNAATSLIFIFEDVPLAVFVYVAFSHSPGEEYHG